MKDIETPITAPLPTAESARKTGPYPLVDPRGVTFLYHGAADSVALRCWIHGLPATQPFERIEGTDDWILRIDLPPNSRIEYKFEVARDGRVEWITDPANPLQAADPFGANSVLRGYGYVRPDWTLPDTAARGGEIDELTVATTLPGGPRRTQVYVPARFRRSRRYPLLVVHDGSDFLRYASLQVVLDNLIHRLEIPSLIAALIDSPERLSEYAGHDGHARFVAEELPAALAERFPLRDDAGARGLMGASFGAVASLHAAWRHPGRYGRLLLESGSFAFSDIGHHRRSATFDPVARFVNQFRAAPGRPADRIYLSCGIYESLIYENRSMVPLLTELGLGVRYEEVRDGHNWENWRDRMRDALSYVYPGPQKLVYE
jgi:enterochelin esterase family protein